MRVVLDTNVLVSMALGGGEVIRRIGRAWRRGDFGIETCSELLGEFAEVIERPHLVLLFENKVTSFVWALLRATEPVALVRPYPASPDPDDDFLLALLRDSDAELLVTGDKALLALDSVGGKRVVSPGSFVQELGLRQSH